VIADVCLQHGKKFVTYNAPGGTVESEKVCYPYQFRAWIARHAAVLETEGGINDNPDNRRKSTPLVARLLARIF
jgi:hypothetical protein